MPQEESFPLPLPAGTSGLPGHSSTGSQLMPALTIPGSFRSGHKKLQPRFSVWPKNNTNK